MLHHCLALDCWLMAYDTVGIADVHHGVRVLGTFATHGCRDPISVVTGQVQQEVW